MSAGEAEPFVAGKGCGAGVLDARGGHLSSGLRAAGGGQADHRSARRVWPRRRGGACFAPLDFPAGSRHAMVPVSALRPFPCPGAGDAWRHRERRDGGSGLWRRRGCHTWRRRQQRPSGGGRQASPQSPDRGSQRHHGRPGRSTQSPTAPHQATVPPWARHCLYRPSDHPRASGFQLSLTAPDRAGSERIYIGRAAGRAPDLSIRPLS